MKRIINNLIGFLLVNPLFGQNTSFGQNDSLLYKVLNKRVSFYCVFNSKEFLQLNNYELEYAEDKSKLLFLNHKPADSSGIDFSCYPKMLNGAIYGYNQNTSNFYSIEANNSITVLAGESLINCDDINHYLSFHAGKIYTIDPEISKKKLIADLTKFLCKAPCYTYNVDEIVHYVRYLNENKLFIETCVGEVGCEFYDYYTIDIKENVVADISKKFKSFADSKSPEGIKGKVWLVSEDKQFYRSLITRTNESFQKIGNRMFLLDMNLNFVNELLIINNPNYSELQVPQIYGINIQDNTIINYYLNTSDDKHNFAIVAYKFSVPLDLALYKAYNDTILTPTEIQDFGQYELNILRNLIFAKHNYQFSSEFYQAYFNLYAFYNTPEKRRSRVKEVNHLLTDVDKANLKLIKTKESKL